MGKRVSCSRKMGGNWINPVTYDLSDVAGQTTTVRLSETVENADGTNHVRINLPDKQKVEILPYEGDYHYYSGKGDNLHTTMSTQVTLPVANEIALTFDSHFDVEPNYDFARVLVNGQPIPGNITTFDDPLGSGLVPAVHSYSKDHPDNVNGWVPAIFDLTGFAGQDIVITFEYITDGGWIDQGFYADNISVVADGTELLADNAESESEFALHGFDKNDGYSNYGHYYMLQWRSFNGVDGGLENLQRHGDSWQYEPGLVVWYADEALTDNWVGNHPGKGWLGVVDADQSAIKWSETGDSAITRFQVRDASFSLQNQADLVVDKDGLGNLLDEALNGIAEFDDRNDYTNPEQSHAGRVLPSYGLNINVVSQADDNNHGVIEITLDDDAPVSAFEADVIDYVVNFVDNSSDKEGPVTSWAWDFGDGATSLEQNPTHTYPSSGDFEVSLTVTDQFGQESTSVQTVTALEPNVLPTPELSIYHFGHWVLFTSFANDSDGEIVDFKWTFGNGESVSGASWATWYNYSESGSYDVSLTVTDDRGGKSSLTQTIDVKGLWD